MHKTEVLNIDSTPEKRLFWSIVNDYDIQTALTELIDNCIDTWNGTDRSGVLQVELELDFERQNILLRDNAGGVPREELRLLVTPGGSKNDPDGQSIGIFGVGSKRAVVAIAETIAIKTRAGSGDTHQIDIDRDWLASDSWELPAYRVADIAPSTTLIEFTRLRRPLAVGDDERFRSHFGSTYERFLRDGRASIVVNGTSVIGTSPEQWCYPPGNEPMSATFEVDPMQNGQTVVVQVTAGLIADRDPEQGNYGASVICNNRMICRDKRTRDFGYFVSSEAGVPHPDASLCRAVVEIAGPAKLMPWNSSKTDIVSTHPTFQLARPTIVKLIGHFSRLSRALKADWDNEVFSHPTGSVSEIPLEQANGVAKLVLPPLPRIRRAAAETMVERNRAVVDRFPWVLGLVEAMAIVDLVLRQRIQTKNRIALILLDSNFEIGLKEFIVHRSDLFGGYVESEALLKKPRSEVAGRVFDTIGLEDDDRVKAAHYYSFRNKLAHERATEGVSDEDIRIYSDVIKRVLATLFHTSW